MTNRAGVLREGGHPPGGVTVCDACAVSSELVQLLPAELVALRSRTFVVGSSLELQVRAGCLAGCTWCVCTRELLINLMR